MCGDLIVSVAFSPDGSTLAACGRRWTYRWDTASWQPLGHRREWASLMGFATDGTFLTAFDNVVNTEVWRDDELTALPQSGRHAVMAFRPDGSVLAVAFRDGVHMWDIGSQRRVHTLEVGERTLVSGGGDGVHVWDLESGTCRLHLFPDGPGATWFAAGLCRFEPGELDAFRGAPRSTQALVHRRLLVYTNWWTPHTLLRGGSSCVGCSAPRRSPHWRSQV